MAIVFNISPQTVMNILRSMANLHSEVLDRPRKTDPLIKCIIKNKAERLSKLIRSKDINGLYPSELWNDDVTPLTAAVLCFNEEICSYLLEESADPNKPSTNRQTPLHYAALTRGVPLSIVGRLLAAKANPNGYELQILTPLQCAVDQDREDIVKALIEAGASPICNFGVNPELDKKVEQMIHHLQLSSQSEVFKKVYISFTFSCALQKKSQMEVYSIYKEHFFQEDPFVHLIYFELYYSVIGPGAEQYHQSAIKWLKDTNSTDRYIEGVIKRFPAISQGLWPVALNCLNAALRISKNNSPQVFSDLVSILTNCLQPSGNEQEKINHLILKILHVMMQKISEQKLRLNHSVYEKLCSSLLPLTRPDYSSLIGVWTYGLFACINDIAPEPVALCGLSPIPEMILIKAEIEMDEVMKRKLQKLNESLINPAGLSAVESLCEETAALSTSRKKKKKRKKKKNQKEVGSQEGEQQDKEEPHPDTVVTSFEKTNAAAQPLTQPTLNPNISRRWNQISRRWSSKLEKLANIDTSRTNRLPGLTLVINPEFLIANGSDGTEVYLGLRDDGTEVAVKQMKKSNYHVLKNEEQFLRLPELDSPSIVRYVDFAEDAHFGYLVLQLCEYTLEEYIQDHLPDDSAERSLILKKLVKEVLCSLQVLHDQQTNILHRDIKPPNVLIGKKFLKLVKLHSLIDENLFSCFPDINGKARLADFGISRRLKQGETTLQTSIAGTRCWKAKEHIQEKFNTKYKRSSDIQVAGMLVYFILSGGQHPFAEQPFCEVNILQGIYSLEHLDDDVAKDLIEWMINEDPKKRPKVEQTLAHPFFWTNERYNVVLTLTGEIQNLI
uniref:Protein kinase domain-containing protein n=1 Tax=Cyprinus carpio TaxID=7962 RepID=A0A8C2E4S5_CYPCA